MLSQIYILHKYINYYVFESTYLFIFIYIYIVYLKWPRTRVRSALQLPIEVPQKWIAQFALYDQVKLRWKPCETCEQQEKQQDL
jgi:hypothetical protein